MEKEFQLDYVVTIEDLVGELEPHHVHRCLAGYAADCKSSNKELAARLLEDPTMQVVVKETAATMNLSMSDSFQVIMLGFELGIRLTLEMLNDTEDVLEGMEPFGTIQ